MEAILDDDELPAFRSEADVQASRKRNRLAEEERQRRRDREKAIIAAADVAEVQPMYVAAG